MSEKKIRIKFDGVDRSESLEEKLIETFQKLDQYFEHVIAIDIKIYDDSGHSRLLVNLHLPQKHFYSFRSDEVDLYKAAHCLYDQVYRKTMDFSSRVRNHY